MRMKYLQFANLYVSFVSLINHGFLNAVSVVISVWFNGWYFNVDARLKIKLWFKDDCSTLIQLSYSTEYQRLFNINIWTLNQHWNINVDSLLDCQLWVNVDCATLIQISYSTQNQRLFNVCLQRWLNVESTDYCPLGYAPIYITSKGIFLL